MFNKLAVEGNHGSTISLLAEGQMRKSVKGQ